MPQIINKPCKLCSLHKSAYTVCMQGWGSDKPKVLIFLDNPTSEEDKRHRSGFSKSIDFIKWMFDLMGIPKSEYRVEFTLKCYAEEKEIKTKAAAKPKLDACYIHSLAILQKYPKAVLVGMGKLTSLAFLDELNYGQFVGCKWPFGKREMWLCYSPSYAMQAPGECPTVYRVLYKAAEEAGLNPFFKFIPCPIDFNK